MLSTAYRLPLTAFCLSSNHNIVYTDSHWHCFACIFHYRLTVTLSGISLCYISAGFWGILYQLLKVVVRLGISLITQVGFCFLLKDHKFVLSWVFIFNFRSAKKVGPGWGTGTPHPLGEESGLTGCLPSIASGVCCCHSFAARITEIQVPARASVVTLLSCPQLGNRKLVAKRKQF